MILKHISIDTSILNHCVDEGITPKEFNLLLEKNGYTPLLVPYVTYECAACFVDTKDPGRLVGFEKDEKGKKLFSYIKELKPDYSCRRDHLYKMECDKIKCGVGVSYLAGKILEDQVNIRIENLCCGNLTEEQKRLIIERLECLRYCRNNLFKPDNIKKYLYKSANFNGVKEKIIDKYKEGDLNFINNLIEFVKMITDPYRVDITDDDVIRFANNHEAYPALRNAIFTNLYLQYSSNKHGDAPSLDKFSDFLILVESSYCSAILTNEIKLKEHFNQINPNIRVMNFDELKRNWLMREKSNEND